jgi:DNA-binding transcriptional MerR regulator
MQALNLGREGEPSIPLAGFTLDEIYDIVAGRSEETVKAELELELTAAQIAAQINHLEQRRSQIEEAVATLREAASAGNAAKQRKTS